LYTKEGEYREKERQKGEREIGRQTDRKTAKEQVMEKREVQRETRVTITREEMRLKVISRVHRRLVCIPSMKNEKREKRRVSNSTLPSTRQNKKKKRSASVNSITCNEKLFSSSC
jgi:hypothetical protein